MTKINVERLPPCAEMRIETEGSVGMVVRAVPQGDIETMDRDNLEASYGYLCRSEKPSRRTGNYLVTGHVPILTAAKRAEVDREAAAAERRKLRDDALADVVAHSVYVIGGLVFIAASLGLGLAGIVGSITPSTNSGQGNML